MVGKREILLPFPWFSRTLSGGVLAGQVWLIWGFFAIWYFETVSVFRGKDGMREV